MNGKMSAVQRYRVLGQPDISKFDAAIRAHVLVPLDPQKNLTENKSVGWASAYDDQDLSVDLAKCIMRTEQGPVVVLNLRVDTLKPDAAQLKDLTKKRQREVEAQRQAPLSAGALRELRDMIALELRQKTPVRTRSVFMLWFVEQQRLYFFSHGKSANETFITLFAQTFNVPVDIEGPGFWAQQFSPEIKTAPTAQMMHGFTGLHPAAHAVEQQATSDVGGDIADFRFLGREFLTWLVFRAHEDGHDVSAETDFRVVIGEKLSMKMLGDGAKAQTHSGNAPAQTQDVHYAIAGGCSVREMDLLIECGDRVWMATVTADTFSLKRIKMPALLSDEDTERAHERIMLFWELDEMIRAAFRDFLGLRLSDGQWNEKQLPMMREWLSRSIAAAT